MTRFDTNWDFDIQEDPDNHGIYQIRITTHLPKKLHLGKATPEEGEPEKQEVVIPFTEKDIDHLATKIARLQRKNKAMIKEPHAPKPKYGRYVPRSTRKEYVQGSRFGHEDRAEDKPDGLHPRPEGETPKQ